MRKDHKRLTREVMDTMKDWYEDNISYLRERHWTEMQRMREGMEEVKFKEETEKTEA